MAITGLIVAIIAIIWGGLAVAAIGAMGAVADGLENADWESIGDDMGDAWGDAMEDALEDAGH